jgi:hypothetical protein
MGYRSRGWFAVMLADYFIKATLRRLSNHPNPFVACFPQPGSRSP